MKYKVFDVVKLKDGNNATILNNIKDNIYKAEIVNINGVRQAVKEISEDEIDKPIIIK